jgi:hypothetical protein
MFATHGGIHVRLTYAGNHLGNNTCGSCCSDAVVMRCNVDLNQGGVVECASIEQLGN